MKTKTTNPTKIGENTNKRNFFQKTVILLAILVFTSFGFKAKAQNEIDITVCNSSGCTWTVKAYDAGSNLIWSSGPISSTSPCNLVVFSCLNQGLLAPALDHITVTGCGGTSYIFGSGGTFSYSQISPVCCGTSIDCAGSSGTNPSTSPCGPTTGKNLLIQMF